jgi:hypothetical protein
MIDFNLQSGAPVKNDKVDLILQQIEMLFDTTPGEVLGDIYYGTKYSEFLYNLQMSNDDIMRTILSDLSTIETFDYTYDVMVDIFQGTMNDIILVRIVFKNDDDTFVFPFKITK